MERYLIQRFKNVVKEDCVYVMLNFCVSHNNVRIKTSCHNFMPEFVDGARIRPVDDIVVSCIRVH